MSAPPVAIVAMADNGVIGRDNGLPWHLPDDLKRFKALTMGHTLLMGRQALSIRSDSALPGRRNLVLTRNRAWRAPDAKPSRPSMTALAAAGDSTLFVIGGAEVFSACLAA